MQILGFPLLIQHGGQLQVAVHVGDSPPVTLFCFYGFNLTLHFMVVSKSVYFRPKSIIGYMNLQTTSRPESKQASE